MIQAVFEIIVCLYAAMQHIFRKSNRTIYLLNYRGFNVILATLCVLLSIISFIVITALLLPLAAYKKTVAAILKLMHGENFGGLLQGVDGLCALETNESRNIINCLFYTTSKNEVEKEILHNTFKETAVYQFTSLRQRYLGYYYRLKNQVDVDDLIKTLELSDDERRDKIAFEKALARLSNAPMPKNDTACFELYVSKKPLLFRDNAADGGNSYPMLARVHHTIGDGVALLSFLLKNLSDENLNIEGEFIDRVKLIDNDDDDDKSLPNVIKQATKSVNVLREKLERIVGANVYYFPPTAAGDRNVLHGPKLSGRKILAHYIEENPGYISKIKSIKKRMAGTTFTDVLMTVISASFCEYFQQKSGEIPDKINLTFSVRPVEKNLHYVVSETTGEKELKLGNAFSMGTLGLPVKIEAATLRERLVRVKEECDKVKNSVDILLNYWQMRFFTDLLPAPVLNLVYDRNQTSTLTFSNLPGIRSVHMRGYKIEDILFWPPNYGKIGVGLSVLTYDGRFQIGLIADENLVADCEEAHGLLDNIIKYVDLLDDELNGK